MKKKKWMIAADAPHDAEVLQRELALPHLAARVLAARGLGSPEQAQAFLDSSNRCIHDPFLLSDMETAVREIERAIAAGEKIAVYGDYDVDGVTATCILIRYLRSRGVDCVYYIPDRLGEGYGLNTAAIGQLYEEGCRLLITVDSGITAIEEAEFAADLGLRLIITDHHECKEVLPRAYAIVNPRRLDSAYPFRELAGVGVAFKLICALEAQRPVEELLEEYGDIVAVGTIADVMPLVGENRCIVTQGLQLLAHTKNPGLRALVTTLGLDGKPVTSNTVSFVMAPRINAAGRMGGAALAARMFLTDSLEEATELAQKLCDLNRTRQEEENRIYQQIVAWLEQEPRRHQKKALVLWGDDWHNGVIGIVASRLTDRYGVPFILISMSGDCGKGSGRSIKGFNLYSALEQCADVLDKYGGHELAVGLSIHRDKLEQLRNRMEELAEQMGAGREVVPCIAVDCRVRPCELTRGEVAGLSMLEPFGMGNAQPCFVMQGVALEELTPISRDRHVKMLLSKDGYSFYAFAFGMGARTCAFVQGDLLDIVFSAEINRYKNRENVQLVIKDVRWAEQEEARDDEFAGCYRTFCGGGTLSREQAEWLSPTRDDLVAVFRHVRANAEGGMLCASAQTLYRKVRYEARSGMNLGRFLICLDVFTEFSIVEYEPAGDELAVRVLPRQGKADINGSRILRRLSELRQG